MSLKNRIIGLAAIGAAALAVAAPLASAKQAVVARTALPSTSLCSTLSYSQVFLPFGDANPYTLTPQGSFEGPIDGWTVTGSAKVVADAGYAGGPVADTASLELSAGSTATSPPICANASTPTFRFFAKALTAGAGAARAAGAHPGAGGNKDKGAGSFAAAPPWNRRRSSGCAPTRSRRMRAAGATSRSA